MLAEILTDFPQKFAERSKLWLGRENEAQAREYRLANHWFHKGRVVLKFEGIDSITDAEALAGAMVQIPREERAKLAEGAIYVSDLVGSKLVDLSSTPHAAIGEVQDVRQGVGAAPLLVVLQKGKEHEIPFAEEYVVRFDAAKKILEMRLPAGLLEVNAPLSGEEKKRT